MDLFRTVTRIPAHFPEPTFPVVRVPDAASERPCWSYPDAETLRIVREIREEMTGA